MIDYSGPEDSGEMGFDPVRHPGLPEAVNDRYTFGDLYALLDETGRAAFAEHGRVLDGQLREQLKRGTISPLYFHRCLARMTQEQLAARSGSRQSFVSRIERSKRPLSPRQAKRFGAVLGVAPEALMD